MNTLTIIVLHGAQYEVGLVDPTHVSLKMLGPGTTGNPWYYHVGQLDDTITGALQAIGVMDSRKYIKMRPEVA